MSDHRPASPADLVQFVARVAHTMDSDPDVSRFAELVAPDATLDFATGDDSGTVTSSLRGRDAIAEWASARRAGGFQGPGSGTRHSVTTTLVVSSTGTRARLLSYFCFYATSDTGPELKAVGSYSDEVVLRDGHLLLAARTVTV